MPTDISTQDYIRQLEERCSKLEWTQDALMQFTKPNKMEFLRYLSRKLAIESNCPE